MKNPRDPNPNLENETLWIFADQLGESPFGVVHHPLAPTFSIVCSGSLGGMLLLRRTSQRCADCSLFCRLDPFLQGSAHWNKRQSKTLWRLAKWTRRSSGLHFFILFSLFVPFCDVVSMLSFKLEIPET
ncbi:hypothetical protein MTR67_051922 [Solanum verrucosum]|uniref:Uncharacterized protein n=1 Tax=Solanum verrucosum TaxID=315347 RepID=A0AAF0V5A2_SOLVR|nr:hypothetical protein MTR67_051922 [Solanum verrucosum]